MFISFQGRVIEATARVVYERPHGEQFEVGVEFATAQVQQLLDADVPGVHFYVLEPDLEARAMAGACVEGVERVDYRGFVDLVAKHPRVQSWL